MGFCYPLRIAPLFFSTSYSYFIHFTGIPELISVTCVWFIIQHTFVQKLKCHVFWFLFLPKCSVIEHHLYRFIYGNSNRRCALNILLKPKLLVLFYSGLLRRRNRQQLGTTLLHQIRLLKEEKRKWGTRIPSREIFYHSSRGFD